MPCIIQLLFIQSQQAYKAHLSHKRSFAMHQVSFRWYLFPQGTHSPVGVVDIDIRRVFCLRTGHTASAYSIRSKQKQNLEHTELWTGALLPQCLSVPALKSSLRSKIVQNGYFFTFETMTTHYDLDDNPAMIVTADGGFDKSMHYTLWWKLKPLETGSKGAD